MKLFKHKTYLFLNRMNHNSISLFKVFMSEDVIKPLNELLMSGYITQGPVVEKFEESLKELFGYPYILSVNSATSGLTLAYRLIKDKENLTDNTEVLSTPLTCMATNLPIIANNLNIKWVDIDKNTALIDLDDLEEKLTEKTKIITFVHWGGYPLNLDKLNNILDKFEIKNGFRPTIIEDCAHSFLSEYNGKKIGTHGNFAVFSLQAIKHLTTGDGGLLFCPNEEYYNKAKLLRWYGIDRDKRNYKGKDFRLEHNVENWGYKYHMNDINATIGLYNLPHIYNLIEKNRENAKYFDEKLRNLKGITLLNEYNELQKSAYWLYTILIEKKQEFIEFMKDKDIMVSQVHQRNDKHTVFNKYYSNNLPNLDELEKKCICIPVGWWLSRDNLEYIVQSITEFLSISC